MASGALASKHPGFLHGQLYADDLVDAGQKGAGGPAGAAFIDGVLAIIDQGGDYEMIRAAVLRHYDDAADPEHVRDVLEKVLTLARLAGARAVLEDDEHDDEEEN